MQDPFEVPWSGYYVQDGVQVEMEFSNMWISMNGQISGSGQDQVGQFNLTGMINPNGCVQLMKQYIGMHTIQYQGTVSPGCISGQWSLNSLRGDFVLNLETQQWQGSFTLDGRTYPMQTNIYVSESGVFGLGKDAEGVFVITGTYNPAAARLTFVKSYLGRYNISYDGSMFDDGQFLVVTGQYTLSTGQQGTYELFQRLEGRTMQYQQFYQPPQPPQSFVPTFYGMPPQMIPPQYQNAMMQGQGGGQLYGKLDDLDLCGGDTDDVRKVIDKLMRGKKIEGTQLKSFLPMIRKQDDMKTFCQNLNSNNVSNFEMTHLVEGLKGAKNQDYNVEAIVFLYPLLTTKPGALQITQLDQLFVFNADKRKVEAALGIDI